MSEYEDNPAVESNETRLLLHACCGPCSMEPVRLLEERGITPTIFYANSNIHPDDEYKHRLETLRAWASSDDPKKAVGVVEGIYNRDEWERVAGRIGDAAIEQARARVTDASESTCSTGEERDAGKAGSKCAMGNALISRDSAKDSSFVAYREALEGGATHEAAITLAVAPDMREARCRACYRLRFEEAAAYAASHGYTAIGSTLSVSPYQYTETIREELERAAAAYGLKAMFEDYRPYYDEATRRSRARGMYRQNFCGCRISDLEAQAERAQRKAQRAAAKAAEAKAHAGERAAAEQERQARRAEKRAYNEKQARKRAILKSLREQQERQPEAED